MAISVGVSQHRAVVIVGVSPLRFHTYHRQYLWRLTPASFSMPVSMMPLYAVTAVAARVKPEAR